MSEKCPECSSYNTFIADSHKSYRDAIHYVEIKYYGCKDCENNFGVRGEEYHV